MAVELGPRPQAVEMGEVVVPQPPAAQPGQHESAQLAQAVAVVGPPAGARRVPRPEVVEVPPVSKVAMAVAASLQTMNSFSQTLLPYLADQLIK